MEEAMKAIASVKLEDVATNFPPFMVIYKDGTIQRFLGTKTVAASKDAATGVESEDVVISPKDEGGVWVRLYKPKDALQGSKRLPVVVYFHGGAFCVETAASPTYHNYLNTLACKANVIVVSVDYRLAPEHPLPAAYEDSWAAVKWVDDGQGHQWIRDYADLSRVFFAGDSAGANISHHMAKRVGKGKEMMNLKLKGILLVHPYFWGTERIGSEANKIANLPGGGMAERLWEFVCPGTSGADDPLINPAMDTELGDLAGEKVMICVAEQDMLRDRGLHYKEALVKGNCKASVEVVETLEENHVFHLLNPASANVVPFMNQVVAFLNSA